MGKYFGTDGIRGVVNVELDAMLAFYVGQAAAMVLSKEGVERPLFTIGKDTRLSCDMLESALIAGLCSAGADVMPLGVLPTPAVAYITCASKADAGIVISASHNPYEHNGIKIFNGQGFKLSDELELEIETLLDHKERLHVKTGSALGRVRKDGEKYLKDYIQHVVSVADCSLEGFRVAVDCANGAAVRTAKEIFQKLSVHAVFIGDTPNGVNINAGVGSTRPEKLMELVVAEGYDLGIAFDGDADRCLVVDEHGVLVDGDKIMAVCALSMKQKGKLPQDAFVATVMSNMGLHEYCNRHNVNVYTAAVGDRNVLEMMQKEGVWLGGEQSGHLIFLEDSTTGDGQLAAVKFLSVLAERKKAVSEIVEEIPTYPQLLTNVTIAGGNTVKNALMSDAVLQKAIASETDKMGSSGRILVRASGTEPLIRIMVEANEEHVATKCSKYLTNLIKERTNSVNS